MNNEKNRKLLYATVIAVLSILLIAVSAVFIITCKVLNGKNGELAEYRAEVEKKLSDAASVSESEATLLAKLKQAEDEKADLTGRIDGMKAELEKLKSELNADEKYASLQAEIDELELTLAAKNKEIENLKQDILFAGNVSPVDVNLVYGSVKKIEDTIASAPSVSKRVVRTVEGVPVLDENGEVIYDTAYSPASVSVCYLDIGRGNAYNCGEKTEYQIPGIKNLAYAYAMMYAEINGTQDEEENAFSIEGSYVLDKKDVNPGSGVLKSEEPGTEYSYRDLLCYLIKYGDETAFDVLNAKLGSSFVAPALRSIGADASLFTEGKATAQNVRALLRGLYVLLEGSSPTAVKAKNAFETSVCGVTNVNDLFADKIGHFSAAGESGCAEAVVVYAERPYIVVVISDLPYGTKTTSDFFTDLISSLRSLHSSFN